MMKGFRLCIAQQHSLLRFNVYLSAITHPCGILLLAQACPRMSCIYTSYILSIHARSISLMKDYVLYCHIVLCIHSYCFDNLQLTQELTLLALCYGADNGEYISATCDYYILNIPSHNVYYIATLSCWVF